MGSRLELHSELLKFVPNAYFQPPSSKSIEHPCVVYHKSGKSRKYGNNGLYLSVQQYKLTVMDKNPDSDIADRIEKHFQLCHISGYYTVDNLNHTSLTLHY